MKASQLRCTCFRASREPAVLLLTILTMISIYGWTQTREASTTPVVPVVQMAPRLDGELIVATNNKVVSDDSSGRSIDPFPPLWAEHETSQSHGEVVWDGHSTLCEANDSVASIPGFSKLSPLIRDFLKHRHCRDFERIIEPRDKCSSGEVYLLLAIKTDARNVHRREVIRRTWAQERDIKGVSVRRVFLAGVHEHHSEIRLLNALLQRENAQHNDVLQWNFYDTFFNLTVKQLLFFDWLNQSCEGVSYIFDGDDDVFVNVDNLVQFLLNQQRQQHLYTGMVIVNAAPILNQHSKYYVPHQIQAKNKYPSYVSGGGIIMSMWTAMQIRVAAPSLPILPIDDVFLGQCLELLGLKPQYHHGFRTSGINLPGKHINSFHPCYYREMLLVHRLLPYQMLPMWEAVQDPKLRCGNPL